MLIREATADDWAQAEVADSAMTAARAGLRGTSDYNPLVSGSRHTGRSQAGGH